MPILGTIASSTRQGLATNSYESIASVTLTSTASEIEFTSIPQTYKHLELRMALKNGGSGAYFNGGLITFNNDTTNANYWGHRFASDDGIAIASVNTRNWLTVWENGTNAYNFSQQFGQILDYTHTNKYKNFKWLEANEDGPVNIYEWNALKDIVWNGTAAITSIKFEPSPGPYQVGSTVALYGIKG